MMNETTFHAEPVLIWTGVSMLEGRLIMPPEASALLLVASPAGTAAQRGYHLIANHLAHHGFGVLYADVLTEDEEQFDSRTGHFRYDIPLIASRLSGIAGWIRHERPLRDLAVTFLGSGSIAAAALKIAAEEPATFAALILAEARTDLVPGALKFVKVPTLLIAPDSDLAILRMNRDAVDELAGEKRLEVLPDSIRVIEDEMNDETVARLALSWAASHAQPVTAW